MISVEQVVQELLRVEGEIPGCAARCGQCASVAISAAGALSPFAGDGGAGASLSAAASSLHSAQTELEQLRGGVQNAISRLKA